MEDRGRVRSRLGRDAVTSFALVLLAVAAVDDITTDSATRFPLERTLLAGCTVWFFVVAFRLWQQGQRVLGGVTFGFVTVVALAQPTLGQATDPWIMGYLATLGALAWFLLVAGILAWGALRSRRSHAANGS